MLKNITFCIVLSLGTVAAFDLQRAAGTRIMQPSIHNSNRCIRRPYSFKSTEFGVSVCHDLRSFTRNNPSARQRLRGKELSMQMNPGGSSDPSTSDGSMTYQTAVRNTAIAVAAAIAFAGGIAAFLGVPKATEFITGYIVEESLSVDNLFVFILLFEVSFTLFFQFLFNYLFQIVLCGSALVCV